MAFLNAMANGFFSYGGAGNVSIYTGLNVHFPAPGTTRQHDHAATETDVPAGTHRPGNDGRMEVSQFPAFRLSGLCLVLPKKQTGSRALSAIRPENRSGARRPDRSSGGIVPAGQRLSGRVTLNSRTSQSQSPPEATTEVHMKANCLNVC